MNGRLTESRHILLLINCNECNTNFYDNLMDFGKPFSSTCKFLAVHVSMAAKVKNVHYTIIER